MIMALSRAVMSLAMCCQGESRREWALAMRAEFDVAVAEGTPFAFAVGCLVTAWREMPVHAEGRDVLSNYALALGLLIPMAALQAGLALGFSSVLAGRDALGADLLPGLLLPGVSRIPMLASSQGSAVPSLVGIWLLLGIGHLRLAWVLVEGDWARVVKASALIGAALATLIIMTATLALDVTVVLLQAAAMAVEAMALVAAARRHARLRSHAALAPLAR